MASSDIFNRNYFKIKKKVIQLIGQSFKVEDESENVLLYSKLKAFKLKEDIRVSTDEEGQNEILSIHARQILDFSANYDVFDVSGKLIGTLQRKGFKSILKDEWILKDDKENELGLIVEDNMALALVRRFLTNLIPQKYNLMVDGQEYVSFDQNFNPFSYRLEVKISETKNPRIDNRMVVAAAILLGAVEGRQS